MEFEGGICLLLAEEIFQFEVLKMLKAVFYPHDHFDIKVPTGNGPIRHNLFP